MVSERQHIAVAYHILTDLVDVQGRFCFRLTQDYVVTTCCVPCPVTEWIYSEQFPGKLQAANYMAVFSLTCSLFLLCTLLIGWKNNGVQSYWTVGLTASLSLITFAFTIPLSSPTDQCYDSITPNDLHSDTACAISGSMLELGAMGAVVWSKCAFLIC